MSEVKKPGVIPTQEQINQANQDNNENQEVLGLSQGEINAALEMKRVSEEQKRLKEQGQEINSGLPEKPKDSKFSSVYIPRENKVTNETSKAVVPPTPPTPPINEWDGYGSDNNTNNEDAAIKSLSEPQFNQPFDVIDLPSEGRLYPGGNKTVKVAYMTTADENILTSPNLVESGLFLEILINRKLLESNLRYKDLLPGDRDAIMLWLRATSYGHMYPVSLTTKDDVVFETEIDLNVLKTIRLETVPTTEGLFEFTLPLSKHKVSFKLLTIGDIDILEKIIESDKDSLINREQTLILERMIVDVDGNRDLNYIRGFANTMRVLDATKLRAYMDSISVGVDMNITVETPGGESLKTFLPITPRFFWPNSRI
jgi:hypothetical protein